MKTIEKTREYDKILKTQVYEYENKLPAKEDIHNNLDNMQSEIDWLYEIISYRIKNIYKNETEKIESVLDISAIPELKKCSYADFIKEHNLTYYERLLLILCFAAENEPEKLSEHFIDNIKNIKRPRPYGGLYNSKLMHFIPTMKTILFILTGHDDILKAYYRTRLTDQNIILKEQIVTKEYSGDNYFSKQDPMIKIELAYSNLFITGYRPRLDYGDQFCATLLETNQTFDDLVVPEETKEKLKYAKYYLLDKEKRKKNNEKSMFSPGYVIMLYGQPGTGKTMTASLLGKEYNLPVYKIDLSKVISKYIGETEKNLEKVFNRLEGKNIILFFDEADSLFGKRTEITDSKDRYANQEVSYLLQRLEKWDGLVILSTNFEDNLDIAFRRRITQLIYYKTPSENERLLLWKKALPEEYKYESEELLEKMVKAYPFTGANVFSVMKLACLVASKNNTKIITEEILSPIVKVEAIKQNTQNGVY